MTPAQPPLPTAWNLPFHPLAGSQTSVLMSESLVGVSVAATRQNGPSATYGFRPRGGPSGGWNVPGATTSALVMAVPLRASVARFSQEAANALLAGRQAMTATAHAIDDIDIIFMGQRLRSWTRW